MEGPTTKLAEVISTRISHDLIGNIGAIGNAVELLEEGDMDFLSDIKNILKISSSVLSNRLKFFRMAFGLENSNIEDAIQVEKVSQAYIKTIGSGEGNGISLRMSLENLTLIGMPGSGKTTVGKKVAKLLGKKFVDMQVRDLFDQSASSSGSIKLVL